MLFCVRDNDERQLIINSVGSKWELTFTTLVVFGGAFFASFPLFYSTSFGGAYWLWMLILLSFVVQAFSYEFRRKRGNIYGRTTYDHMLQRLWKYMFSTISQRPSTKRTPGAIISTTIKATRGL